MVDIGNGEVDDPARRHAFHFGSDLHDAAVAASVVIEDGVVIIVGVDFVGPAEEIAKEFFGGCHVGGIEFVPGHGADGVDETCTWVFAGLPEGDVGTAGVLDGSHAAGVEDVHGGHGDFAAEGFNFGNCFVELVDSDVARPEGRHVVIEGGGAAGYIMAIFGKHGVVGGVGTCRHVLEGPAE